MKRKCKHRLGRGCSICNGLSRAIVQPAPVQHREVRIPTKNLHPEKTMFIQGTPYVSCGNCNIPTKQFDGDSYRRGTRDNYIKSDTQRKIMIGKFIKTVELIDTAEGQAFKETWKLVLQSKIGCYNCWSIQQREIEAEKARCRHTGDNPKAVFFKK